MNINGLKQQDHTVSQIDMMEMSSYLKRPVTSAVWILTLNNRYVANILQ